MWTWTGGAGGGESGKLSRFPDGGKVAGTREGRAGGENQVETRGSEVHPGRGAARSQEKGGAETDL